MKTANLVIFDLDGTLVDSAGDLLQAINYVRQRYAYPPLDMTALHAYIGDGVEELVARALPRLAAPGLQDAVAQFKHRYEQHLLDTTVLFPGMRETLASLQGNVLAVVTNKTELYARRILAGVGIEPYFAVCLGGDSGPARKPAPDALLAVMAYCGTAAAQTVMVGDGRNDVLAASAAGVRSIAVGYGYSTVRELAAYHPSAIIHDPHELVSLIG